MKKNVASQVVGAQLVSKTDGSNVTSGTTTVYVVGDGGTQGTGSVGSGAATHEGHGFWTYAPAQAETNYDHVAFTFENTSAVTASVQIYPSFPQTGDNYARIGAPVGASISADIAGVQSDTDNIQTRLPTSLVSGRIDASVGAVATGAITAAAIADAAIDRATFAADTGMATIRSNTAQAGAAGTVTLDASASATTDFYVGTWILLTGGTGVGQARVCTAYNGTSKVATIAPNWATNPDNTSTFAVLPAAQITGVQGAVTGAVGSVTGAVGSVTGAVGSIATGGIVAASFAAGAIDNAAIATDAIGSAELAASAVTEIQSGLSTLDAAGIRTAVGLGSANLDTQLAALQSDTDNIQTRLPTSLVSGRIDASVGAVAAGAITAAAIADGAIDSATFAADTGMVTTRAGTAQSGTSTTITLDASASSTDSLYVGQAIVLTGGTGAGQVRVIWSYVGSSKLASVTRGWTVNPDNTTTFAVRPVDQIIGANNVIAGALSTQTVGAVSAGVNLATGAIDVAAYASTTTPFAHQGTVGTGSTSTTIKLAAGASATDDVYNGLEVIYRGDLQVRTITDYDGTTKVATVFPAWVVTPSSGQSYDVMKRLGDVNVLATTLDAAGVRSAVGLASANLDTQIAAVQSDTDNIQTRLPAALVSGRMDASVGAMAAGVLTATAIAADAITDAKVASDVTIASVTGAVGSVTGNVGGNVTGSVGSVAAGGIAASSFAAGAIDAAAIATDAFGALEVAAGAASEIATAVRTELATELARVDVAVSTRLATSGYTAPLDAAGTRSAVGLASANLDTQLDGLPTAAENADAVWEEVIADHSGTSGSTAEALNAAGSAGDPWTTALPGAYAAGQAGYIVGTNLDATVGSRLPTSSYTAPLSAAGTRSAVGMASANLDTQIGTLATAANLATVAGYVDTEVAAIKAKTDLIPASPAASTDAASALAAVGLTTTITGRIDAAISTRLASSGYTVPPTAASVADAVLHTPLTEGYAADGAVFTLEQSQFMQWQFMQDRAIVGTELRVRKLDKVTLAMTFDLDSGSAPTSQERSA